jgi:cell wall-associated NlpC family hydrolase
VLDGRKRNHARALAGVTAVLAATSLGLVASPATAAPDTAQKLDAVQARVDKLSEKAQTAEAKHHKAATKLAKARAQLHKTAVDIRRHERLIEALRAQVAATADDTYAGTSGSSAPRATAAPTSGSAAGPGSGPDSGPALDAQTKKDSTTLLANVVLVSEDAGAPADALARSNAQLGALTQRKVALQNSLDMLARGEHATRSLERVADNRQAKASATLEELQAQRIEEMGGPAVAYAKSKVGDAYVYGAAGPSAFDCSGLTMAAWSQAGVSLPHSSSAQYSSGRHISESELQPGDLVFYYSPISHVGMYIGHGQIVNALNPGAGVVISGLHDMPYVGAVRPGA